MDVAVDLECPECLKIFRLNLSEFSPGTGRFCIDCMVPPVLTENGLRDLRRRLCECYPAPGI